MDEGGGGRVAGGLVGARQRPAGPMPLRGAALVVLRLEEVGEEVVPGPAGRPPLIVVAAVAPDVDHRVDRGRAAQHLAARQRDTAAVAARLGRREVAPVDLGAGELQVTERDVDVLVRVRRPGLEQQHADVGILGQSSGQDTAGRARSHDHVVVGGHHIPGGPPMPPIPPMSPVIPPIFEPAKSWAARSASLTAAWTMSARISASSGSIASGSIAISRRVRSPPIFTLTMPPPALASTTSSLSCSCASSICCCICCACFINAFTSKPPGPPLAISQPPRRRIRF